MMKILFCKGKLILSALSALAGIFCALRFSEECTRGIIGGISLSVQVLVPSLFVFMTAAALISKSRAVLKAARPLNGVSKALFGLPYPSMAAVILSCIGGYPVGARSILNMYENGILNEKQAEKTAYIAVAAGPGFLVNYIGSALLNNRKAGYILLFSQLTAVLFTGIIVGRIIKIDANETTAISVDESNKGSALVDAVSDAAAGTFSLCSMVILFSAVAQITDTLFSDNETLNDILTSFLEVTTGCNKIAGRYPLYFIAFFTGFGGLSVHFQIFASLKSIHVNRFMFFVTRVIEGIICSVFSYILVSIFPVTQAVFSTAAGDVSLDHAGTLWGSGALILSSLVFLGSIGKEQNRRQICAE